MKGEQEDYGRWEADRLDKVNEHWKLEMAKHFKNMKWGTEDSENEKGLKWNG